MGQHIKSANGKLVTSFKEVESGRKARGVKLDGPRIREAQQMSIRVRAALVKKHQSKSIEAIREIITKGRFTTHAGILALNGSYLKNAQTRS